MLYLTAALTVAALDLPRVRDDPARALLNRPPTQRSETVPWNRSMSWLHPFWAFAPADRGVVPARLVDVSARSTRPPTAPAGASTPCRCSSAACSAAASRPRMDWKRYAVALLAFNAALFVLTFGLLYAQQHLPLNPDGKGSLGALGYKDAAGRRPPRRRHRR